MKGVDGGRGEWNGVPEGEVEAERGVDNCVRDGRTGGWVGTHEHDHAPAHPSLGTGPSPSTLIPHHGIPLGVGYSSNLPLPTHTLVRVVGSPRSQVEYGWSGSGPYSGSVHTVHVQSHPVISVHCVGLGPRIWSVSGLVWSGLVWVGVSVLQLESVGVWVEG